MPSSAGPSRPVGRGPLTLPVDPRPDNRPDDAKVLKRKVEQVSRGGARAAVLAVNDGLISNLCLILGVAGASASQGSIRLAGFASLIAGAFSMAAGEWVSVRSQVELYGGVLREMRSLLQRNPKIVLDELVDRLDDAGFPRRDAQRLSTELPLDEQSFMDFTARTVFGVDPDELGSPATAAATSLLLFAIGAIVPLLPWFFTSGASAIVWSSTLTGLAGLVVGGTVARSAGTTVAKGAARQFAIVVVVSAVTFGIGKLFGTAVN